MAMASTSSTCNSASCTRIFLTHSPTLPGNVTILTLFAILIPIALALGIKYRSLAFATTIATGLALEVVGYIGRILLHTNPSTNNVNFAVFLVGTTLGPTCICGAMFLVMPRIIAVYGVEYQTWRSAWYLFFFSALTTGAFILELAGSVVSTVLEKPVTVETGARILVAGLAIQLVALVIFAFHAILFAIALQTRRHDMDPRFAHVYDSGLFKASVAAYTVATTLVLIRTTYRTVQIAEGFQSSIAQDEVLFLVLDAVAMLIAVTLLLTCFPARVLGQSGPQIEAHRLLRRPPRPIRPPPVQLTSARPSPTYNRMSMKSSTSAQSPGKSPYPPVPARQDLVDSDALW